MTFIDILPVGDVVKRSPSLNPIAPKGNPVRVSKKKTLLEGRA